MCVSSVSAVGISQKQPNWLLHTFMHAHLKQAFITAPDTWAFSRSIFLLLHALPTSQCLTTLSLHPCCPPLRILSPAPLRCGRVRRRENREAIRQTHFLMIKCTDLHLCLPCHYLQHFRKVRFHDPSLQLSWGNTLNPFTSIHTLHCLTSVFPFRYQKSQSLLLFYAFLSFSLFQGLPSISYLDFLLNLHLLLLYWIIFMVALTPSNVCLNTTVFHWPHAPQPLFTVKLLRTVVQMCYLRFFPSHSHFNQSNPASVHTSPLNLPIPRSLNDCHVSTFTAHILAFS